MTTNVNAAKVYMKMWTIWVVTVKHVTVGVTPTLVRMAERASMVTKRVALVNRALRVSIVKTSITAFQIRVFTVASASMKFSIMTVTALTLATQEATVKLTSTSAHQTPVSMETALTT